MPLWVALSGWIHNILDKRRLKSWINLKKTPDEKFFIQKRRMTNIVFVWRFLLDISVSVTLKNDQRQKTFRGMTFHRNPPNVCKTSFRRSECCLDISLASGRVKITRWLFSVYTFLSVYINFPVCEFRKLGLIFNRSLDSRFGKCSLERISKF